MLAKDPILRNKLSMLVYACNSSQEVEARGSRSEASSGKSMRPYLENKLMHKQGLVEWLEWWNTCLASTRP
jgi:hypothetical protein